MVIFDSNYLTIVHFQMTILQTLLIGILGIYLASIFSTYYTQKIYTQPYKFYRVNNNGLQKEKYFKYPLLVGWLTSLICAIWGWILGQIKRQKQNPIVLSQRRKLGFLFTLNMIPNLFSLLYVNFYILIVVKTIRYLFLIIFGSCISKNQNTKKIIIPRSKIFGAMTIMLSTFFFIYQIYSQNYQYQWLNVVQKYVYTKKLWIGVTIILITIVSDAFFVDQQVFCRNNYFPTPNHIFQSSNFYSFLILFTISFLRGTLFQQLRYIYNYPQVKWDLGCICLLQLLNQQISLYFIVVNFNQSIYPLISSTRRILLLILQTILWNHTSLNYMQHACIFIICLAICRQLILQVKQKDNQLDMPNQSSQKRNDDQFPLK